MANRRYKIHPAIGIARVGNADADTYFIGPESPGEPVRGATDAGSRVPPFKADKAGELIRPQAARFRIWEYTRNAAGKWAPSREINYGVKGLRRLKWTVRLANHKAMAKRPSPFFSDDPDDPVPVPVPAPAITINVSEKQLKIDPGPRSIAGPLKKGPAFSAKSKGGNWPRYPEGHPEAGRPIIDYLGELRTDAAGRLIVIGGKGVARSIEHPTPTELRSPIANPGWYDDVSDGPVTAEIDIEIDGRVETIRPAGAWIVVGPPAFAPPVKSVVTLYDVLFDLAARKMKLPADDAIYDTELAPLRLLNEELYGRRFWRLRRFKPTYETDIAPVLRRALDYGAVTLAALDRHPSFASDDAHDLLTGAGPASDRTRRTVFRRLAPPLGVRKRGRGKADMPRVESLTLTYVQYAMFHRWKNKDFVSKAQTTTASSVTPHGLDRAALEHACGGPFSPGMEISGSICHPDLFVEPFRLRIRGEATGQGSTSAAGDMTEGMAVPWQADFVACAVASLQDNSKPIRQVWAGGPSTWWPAQRPEHVRPRGADYQDRRDWFRPNQGTWKKAKPSRLYRLMIDHWHKMGFVVPEADDLVEAERAKGAFG